MPIIRDLLISCYLKSLRLRIFEVQRKVNSAVAPMIVGAEETGDRQKTGDKLARVWLLPNFILLAP